MRAPHRLAWMIAATLAFAPLCSAPAVAQADSFPNHPVKIIIGPSPDIFSRIVGEHLQQAWGQPVVVEPRPGAGGKIAVQAVSAAPPDGYSMLFATPTYTLNTAMGTASYDIMKEFDPVALIGLISYALVINPNVPVNSVAELVAYAKANPGKLNCASAGIGTVPHLACEYLNKVAGINIVHVPYRDVNSATMATVGGTTQLFFGVSTSAKSQIDGGSLRGLAVSTGKRSLLLPNLPTMVESGFPSFDMPGWGGLITTAGTPKDVVAKINAEVRRAVERPELQKRLIAVGMEPPPPQDPAQFREFVASDIARWSKFVEAVGTDKLKGGPL
jgi:tripartite-type tricarboxylate transporter receptor subunit TctC